MKMKDVPRADIFLSASKEEVKEAFEKLAQEIHKEGALSSKEKALIALACAVSIRCDHCVRRHAKHAALAGVSREEMLKAAAVAGLVRAGSGFTSASYILDQLEGA
jgi:AhpD family alkylhydroperoxidase